MDDVETSRGTANGKAISVRGEDGEGKAACYVLKWFTSRLSANPAWNGAATQPKGWLPSAELRTGPAPEFSLISNARWRSNDAARGGELLPEPLVLIVCLGCGNELQSPLIDVENVRRSKL